MWCISEIEGSQGLIYCVVFVISLNLKRGRIAMVLLYVHICTNLYCPSVVVFLYIILT